NFHKYSLQEKLILSEVFYVKRLQSATEPGGSLSSSSNRSKSEKSSTAKYKSLNKSPQKSPDIPKRRTQTLSPSTQRKSYAEEVESEISSASQKNHNEKALVRRITNQMQIAQYDKCDDEHPLGATVTSNERAAEKYSKPVYRLYAFRFAEAGLRRALWYLARAVAARKILFSLLPIAFVLLSLTGLLAHRENLRFMPPFDSFLSRSSGTEPSSGFTNLRLKQPTAPRFNGSNAAYSVLRRNSPSEFAVLLKARYEYLCS
ncbi:unnamed protein product, partial [Toxocara canis]|uniref:SSD domain-containing protein n=1 Tax=Toxocara canis TaxID=6265 RepID=A0A183UDY3_TOXCA